MRDLARKARHLAVFLWMAPPMILCEAIMGAGKGAWGAARFAWRQSRPTWRSK